MSHPTKPHHRKEGQKKKSEGASGTWGSMLQSALFGALCGLISATLLLFAATAICYATADPASLTGVAGLCVLYLSAFVAGFAALRRHRSMALACGSMSGLFLLLVFLCLSLVLRHEAQSLPTPSQSLLLRVLMLPVSALGGYLGLSRKSPKKRRARK